jgi:hypothetical protein
LKYAQAIRGNPQYGVLGGYWWTSNSSSSSSSSSSSNSSTMIPALLTVWAASHSLALAGASCTSTALSYMSAGHITPSCPAIESPTQTEPFLSATKHLVPTPSYSLSLPQLALHKVLQEVSTRLARCFPPPLSCPPWPWWYVQFLSCLASSGGKLRSWNMSQGWHCS